MDIIQIIQEVLSSSASSTDLSRKTGLSRQLIDKYRKGQSEIENMSLKNALNIKKYWEELQMKNIANQEKLAFMNHLAEVAADPKNRLSNEMDDKIWRNKQDVVALYERIEKGEAFVYTGEEYREYLDELIADDEDLREVYEEKWEEYLESNSELVIEEYGEASFV